VLRKNALAVVVASVTAALVLPVIALRAQPPAAALTGLVSSQDEGAMGGVLVSAKRAGSTITIFDKAGFAWAGGMNNDHVVRVNTRTGETVEYLLPRATNIRRVNVDNSTNPPTFWVGNNLGASIIKVEPLD
jgi:hypothetical protein